MEIYLENFNNGQNTTHTYARKSILEIAKDEGINVEVPQNNAFCPDEAKEGRDAFLEKRPPNFEKKWIP